MGIKDETKIASWGWGTDWSTIAEGKCWIVNFVQLGPTTIEGSVKEKPRWNSMDIERGYSNIPADSNAFTLCDPVACDLAVWPLD